MGFKSGFVTVIGKTNVGKSSLINDLIGEQVSIVVNKSQTTRKVARGIYTDEEAQIVFVDTPGLHKANSKLGTTMNEAATSTIEDVDVIIFVVDSKEKNLDRETVEIIKQSKIPAILVINKIDLIGKAKVASLIN